MLGRLRRWILLVLATARVASADDGPDPSFDRAFRALERLPGAANDAVAGFYASSLEVATGAGYAIDGGMPQELVTRVDGFEVPLFHRDGRSAATWLGFGTIRNDHTGRVDWGGGSSELELTSRSLDHGVLDASTLDATAGFGSSWFPTLVLRRSLLGYAVPSLVPADRELAFASAPTYTDLIARTGVRLSAQWTLTETFYEADDGVDRFADRARSPDQETAIDRTASRVTLAERYTDGAWAATLAQSVMAAHDNEDRGLAQHHHERTLALDTRAELEHATSDVAGLSRLVWTLGGEAHVTRHALDIAGAPEPRENVPRAGEVPFDDISHVYRGTVWTPDLGAWTSAEARLSPHVVATMGVRLDAFGSDLTLQPRGSLAFELAERLEARLEAGAYRRAPERGEELEHSDLHPERTTRIAVSLGRSLPGHETGWYGRAAAYYLDRTRLIERDGLGVLANTGRGTTYGLYALAGAQLGPWLAQLALRLEHSDRQDAPRALVRPFEYDQPVRLEARITRFWGRLSLGARFELRSGLPYTAVVASELDTDRDVYTPDFGRLYAERLPWQHRLDLRADWQLARHVALYLEVANVYDHRPAVGWDYNFNFAQRRAIEAPPIWPTLGVRGEL
jgi:hypothetical protein